MIINERIRPTYIEVNLSSIARNIALVRSLISAQCAVLLPVKADAYGHGALAVSSFVQQHKLVDMLGVASVEEGVELRENGITLPILVLGVILARYENAEMVVKYNLIQSVTDKEVVAVLSAAAKKLSLRAQVHIKVDTGMQRLGCTPEEVAPLADMILDDKALELSGIFSHMPLSDEHDANFNKIQIAEFTKIASTLKVRIPSLCVHMSNSAAILNFPEAHLSMVRPGILSYGYPPFAGGSEKLIPAMRFCSAIVACKRVEAGTSISYGHTYTTKKESFIATIPVGYGDGYHRALSNKAEVLIAGKKYPIAGRVCMDLMMIDCGDDEYPCGTEVELFGAGDITADTLAALAGTISYEITCAPSRRVPRIYLSNQESV